MLEYIPTNYMASILDLLVALNPWWSGKPFEAGIRRERYFTQIEKYLGTGGEIVVLTGVRRSGKTTLLFQVIDDLIRNRRSIHDRSSS